MLGASVLRSAPMDPIPVSRLSLYLRRTARSSGQS